ncbi:MAG: RsmD family RNA methyltransferase [bacterium]|nr:RsmD family RNA methyltransferase [bacterium]
MSQPNAPHPTETVDALMESLSTDGRAVVRVDGTVFFVGGALPGDRAELELCPHTHPPSARLVRLLEPSPYRASHPCPEAVACCGSVWGVLAYQEQLQHKRELVLRTLRKAVGDIEVLPTVASPLQWHYRNRLSLSVWMEHNRARIGFQTEPRSRGGTPVRTCLLAHESLLPCLRGLADLADDLHTDGAPRLPRRIQIHRTRRGAGVLLVFAGELEESDGPDWRARLKNVPMPGGLWLASGTRAGIADLHKPLLRMPGALPMLTAWLGNEVEVHPAEFCQANSGAADLVLERLRSLGESRKFARVWDLYGGYGALGMAAAGTRPLTVLEQTSLCRETLEALAAHAGNTQAEFMGGDLLRTVKNAASRMMADDLVILDPPRSGAHREVLMALAESHARHAAYLSCNPARLGRDLALLFAAGFRAAEIQPYDFFPQTPRIEVFCLLQRL